MTAWGIRMRQGPYAFPNNADGFNGGTGAVFWTKLGLQRLREPALARMAKACSPANNKENILRAIERIRAVL